MKKTIVLVIVLVFALSACGTPATALPTVVPSTEVPTAAMPPTTAPTPTPEPTSVADFNGYYMLQTMFLESENKCLEGNRLGGDVLGGAAFMNDCATPSSGQLWKLVPADDGYYTLQTMFLESENKCLEGNRLGGDVLGGAAFMNDCATPSSGQLWKLVPADDGYYTLQTMFLESENKCLEGNRLGGDALGGAAFMNDCAVPSSGQLWKLVPAP
jgi:hypothetical protein